MLKGSKMPRRCKNKKTKRSYYLKVKSKSRRKAKTGRRGGARKGSNILASGKMTSKKLNLSFFSKKSKSGKKQIVKSLGKPFLLRLLKK